MVKRADFERELIAIIAPAVTRAQDIMKAKYGISFSARVDWKLTRGQFEDDPVGGVGIGG